MKLEKLVSISCLLLLAGIMVCCSEKDNQVVPKAIMLAVDKKTLKSDGTDLVTFSVTADGTDISADAKLFYRSADHAPFELSGKSFATNISGTYLFYATYEGLTSQEIQVDAISVVLIFSADNDSIKADGTSCVHFTVLADDKDVSKTTDIYIKTAESDILLENNLFSTDREGVYEFYCQYGDQLSDVITITAVPLVLTLLASEASFKANGKEAITFSVTEDGRDLTGEAEIYCKTAAGDILIDDNMFTTLQAGLYEFYAQYLHLTSNTVTVEAVVSTLTLSSDKTEVKTGEAITFTAMSDNLYDVSNEATFYITCDDGTVTTHHDPVFTPLKNGLYSVHATYDDKESNTVQLSVSPKKITLTVDKTSIKSTGADRATFTVFIDDLEADLAADHAEIFQVSAGGDIRIADGTFSSNLVGTYSFYAQYGDLRSALVTVQVQFVNFSKQSCTFGFFATWCGFTPQMISVFHEIRETYPNQIQTIAIHRATSALSSTDVRAEDYLDEKGITSTPHGTMDFYETIARYVPYVYDSYRNAKQLRPAKSGIAITSQISDGYIRVNLRIVVTETSDYSIGAVIVEDNVVKRQIIYYNPTMDDYEYLDNFVHHSVATYLMPGTKIHTGKRLGILQPGQEVTESFSIPTDKPVTAARTVNHANCRVVAYVFKKEGNNLYVNNAATCPINGSVDYQYE